MVALCRQTLQWNLEKLKNSAIKLDLPDFYEGVFVEMEG